MLHLSTVGSFRSADLKVHFGCMIEAQRLARFLKGLHPPLSFYCRLCCLLVDKVKKETPVHAHSIALRRHWWHHEVRPDHHWSHVAGGCIRSTPELSRRLPSNRCGSRRCDEGRCGRCRPFDSCAPRMVGGAQQSTLRPLDRAAANLAAAGTMESCAMILRAVHPWPGMDSLARPSCPSLGNF